MTETINKFKTIAIIGGGISGVLCCKEALENSLNPTIFEAKSELLGIWSSEGYSWKNMNVNVSNHLHSLESQGWPLLSNPYPTKEEYKIYLEKYIKKHKIEAYCKLNSQVIKVNPAQDFQSYEIVYSTCEGSEISEKFDSLIIATGNFQVPKLSGFETYINNPKTNLKIEHSSEYKGAEHYKGKRVIVVGNSFSGAQISAELAKSASLVINAFHSKRLMIPKFVYHPTYKKKIPAILSLLGSRSERRIMSLLEDEQIIREKNKILSHFDNQYDINELKCDFDSDHPVRIAFADNYVELARENKIILEYSDIKNIENSYVSFENGNKHEVDVVMLCTGYKKDLNFLDKKLQEILCYDQEKFMCIELDQSLVYNQNVPNVAFVGLYYLLIQTLEMQSRVAIRYLINPSNQIKFAKHSRQVSEEKKVLHNDIAAYIERLAEESESAPDFELIKSVDQELYSFVMDGIFLSNHFGLKEKWYGTDRWNKNAELIKLINKDLLRNYE